MQQELQDFFPADAIGWKPQAVNGNRALAIAYIDARDVENRLDAVVGIDCWKDAYEVLADGNVVCTLSIRLGDEWVSKTDVGGESDQKDDGDLRNGGDMYETPGWGLPVVDMAACEKLCSTTAGCKYFTHAWGNCYIKGLSTIKLVSPEAVSDTCGGAAVPAGPILAALPGVAVSASMV